jgi:hypothetical protein
LSLKSPIQPEDIPLFPPHLTYLSGNFGPSSQLADLKKQFPSILLSNAATFGMFR